MFDVILIQKTDPDYFKIQYSLKIKSWTSELLTLNFNFEDPYTMSRGVKNDTVYISFKNPKWFVSAVTKEPFNTS